ncbi:MAG: hypothetical protein CW338_03560 [Clostridiales bacterium]|nr:hypothetical protein [Clostridiales bacterium]
MNNELTKPRNVFRIRNFRLVFFGALVSELGATLYNFAVGFYILEISGNNAFLQGLYLALCGASMLVFTPIGGVLGDRFSKAKIMYLCDYLKGSSILLATALMLLFPAADAQLVILFTLGILGNAVSGIFNPAAGALFPHIVKEEQLQQANSYFSMKSALEGIAGVILAGILYTALPIYLLFIAVGVCFIGSAVSEMLIRCEYTPSDEHLTLKLAFRDMADGVRYLKTKKAILALLGAILFINFFFTPVTGNFLPFFIKTDLAAAPDYLFSGVLTPELWSSIFSVCFGISSLIAAAVLSAKKQAEKCGFRTALRLCATAAAMIVLTACYWLLADKGENINGFLITFCLICLAMGTLISLINIPISTATMRIVDRDRLSKVNSIISIGAQGMIPIASVLAGIILENLGTTVLLLFCTLGFTVTAVLLLFNRRIREL